MHSKIFHSLQNRIVPTFWFTWDIRNSCRPSKQTDRGGAEAPTMIAEPILIFIWVVLAAILFSGRLIPSMWSSHLVPSVNSVTPYQHCFRAARISILLHSYSFTAKTFVGRRLSKTLQSVSIAVALVCFLSCCTHPIYNNILRDARCVISFTLTRPLRTILLSRPN